MSAFALLFLRLPLLAPVSDPAGDECCSPTVAASSANKLELRLVIANCCIYSDSSDAYKVEARGEEDEYVCDVSRRCECVWERLCRGNGNIGVPGGVYN